MDILIKMKTFLYYIKQYYYIDFHGENEVLVFKFEWKYILGKSGEQKSEGECDVKLGSYNRFRRFIVATLYHLVESGFLGNQHRFLSHIAQKAIL